MAMRLMKLKFRLGSRWRRPFIDPSRPVFGLRPILWKHCHSGHEQTIWHG